MVSITRQKEFFPGIPNIRYEGPDSKNRLAFKHYDANELVREADGEKTAKDRLRFSMTYWHTIRGGLSDMFG